MAEARLEHMAFGIPEPACLTATLTSLCGICFFLWQVSFAPCRLGPALEFCWEQEKKDEILHISFKENVLASNRERERKRLKFIWDSEFIIHVLKACLDDK